MVPLQITGPPSERLNLVIMGDGYQAHELDQFRADVDRNLNVQWSIEPFRSYRHYFNVYRLEIVSQDSGISCDPDDGNVKRNTPLRLGFANTCPAPAARARRHLRAGADARNGVYGPERTRLLRHAAAQPLPVDVPRAARRVGAERPDPGARQHVHLRRDRRHAGDDVRRQPPGPAHLDARARALAGPDGRRVPVFLA